ncbi:zf-HC2 domain-containing protein [Bacteroidota bacterium]
MKKDKISCKEVMHHICDNLGEELNSPKCVAIKEHLEQCDNCQKYYDSIELTIDLYKKYDIHIAEDVHDRLMDHLGLKE